MGDTILAVCLGVVLCWTSALAQKSHTLSINKLELMEANADWVETGWNMHLSKKGTGVRVFNWKGSLKKNITAEILCKATVLQKINGKFMPTAMDTAEKPCCESVENYNVVWPCVTKFSNFPQACPIVSGPYSIEKLDLNECDVPVFLPPKSPENYKIIFTAKHENKPILTVTAYATAKMKMLG